MLEHFKLFLWTLQANLDLLQIGEPLVCRTARFLEVLPAKMAALASMALLWIAWILLISAVKTTGSHRSQPKVLALNSAAAAESEARTTL